jgi:hypothetical protein
LYEHDEVMSDAEGWMDPFGGIEGGGVGVGRQCRGGKRATRQAGEARWLRSAWLSKRTQAQKHHSAVSLGHV